MRYLIVQLADLGDLLLSFPALAALRQEQPDAHITVLTTAHTAPVLDNTGLADEVICFERQEFSSSRAFFKPANLRRIWNLRRRHFDAVLFFHHFTLKLGTLKFALIGLACGAKQRVGLDNGNGWFLNKRLPDGGFGAKHQAQYWLDLVAAISPQSFPLSPFPSVFRPQSSVLSIVIHPGSGGYSMARRWEAAGFAAVADALREAYQARIVLVGGANDNGAAVKEAMKSEAVDLTGKTTLAELAEVIRAADVFIGADSGVMHLAAAVGTPVVAIFGPSNPDAWGPWTPDGKSVVVRSAVECSPCSYVGHGIGLREGCAARTCMRMVTVGQVVEAAKGLLEGKRTPSLPLTPKINFPRRVHILGFPVDAIRYEEWLEMIGVWVTSGVKAAHVCTVNPEFMMIARRDSNFGNILRRADVCVPDGVGLLWAARTLGTPLPERVTGSDGVPRIAERAARQGWRLFFLGAAPGVAEQAADVLRKRHPGLQIVGTYSGSPAPEEEDAIIERVNASSADILFVAYGAPEQDKWIARNLPRLGVKMAMGVGGSFDFIAGIVPRAPMWIQQRGLEWLFRLYLQPRRIGRMMRLPLFALLVLLKRS